MDASLFVAGIGFGVTGGFILGLILLYPESARRENRRASDLTRRAKEAGLRGKYAFAQDRSKWDTTGEFGTYTPADEEDRAVYAAVGSRIEGESAFFSRASLWTDERFAWVGVPALIIGAVACAISFLA